MELSDFTPLPPSFRSLQTVTHVIFIAGHNLNFTSVEQLYLVCEREGEYSDGVVWQYVFLLQDNGDTVSQEHSATRPVFDTLHL